MRAIHSRAWKITLPSALAEAPRARKMIVNPAMKRSACASARRRDTATSSRLIPVMKVT